MRVNREQNVRDAAYRRSTVVGSNPNQIAAEDIVPLGTRAVVVGVDDGPNSHAAMQWAADMAHRHGMSLGLVRAIPRGKPPDVATAAHSILDRARDEVAHRHPDLPVTMHLLNDSPGPALVAAASGTALIVVGGHGHGAIHEVLHGSVSRYAAENCTEPVAVIRHRDAPTSMGPIVVGVDGTRAGRSTIRYALREAALRRASVHLVYAWQEAGSSMPTVALRRSARRTLDTVRTSAHTFAPTVEITDELIYATPETALLAASQYAELLIIGRRPLGHLSGLLLGSVTTAAVHHAGCPVIIVPRGHAHRDQSTEKLTQPVPIPAR